MDIHYEIEFAKTITISNDNELLLIKEKYFSKTGILPTIYKLASSEKVSKSDKMLHQLVELRCIIDSKIKQYKSIN